MRRFADRVAITMAYAGLILLAAGGCGGGGGSGAPPSPGGYVYTGPEEIVFLLPPGAAAPPAVAFARAATHSKVDIYLLMDNSPSLAAELSALAANLPDVISALVCAPSGTGTPPSCAMSIHTGVGIVDGVGGVVPAFQHVLSIQDDPLAATAALPTGTEGGTEAVLASIWSIATGVEISSSGCMALVSAPPAGLCTAVGRGGCCFRVDSLAVIALLTDEAPTTTLNCPDLTTAAMAAQSLGARIVGITGSGADAQTTTDLQTLAAITQALDATGMPIVESGADALAPSALQSALSRLLAGLTLTVDVRLVDEPGDAGDALQFFDRFAATQPGGAGCSTGLMVADTNADGVPDRYISVPSGTSLCWDISAVANASVPATSQAQVFKARIEVVSEDALLATVTVAFVVPPN